MVDSVGKKLAAAREAKALSLDEIAHATKIRPDKLLSLEQDDFSAFPNNTYARGFLLIYGRYLGVEVGAQARALENGNPISVQDYQYLNAATDEEIAIRTRARNRQSSSRRPSLMPLIVFVVLLIGAGYGIQLFLEAQRLSGSDKDGAAETQDAVADPSPDAADAPAPASAPVATPARESVPVPAPVPAINGATPPPPTTASVGGSTGVTPPPATPAPAAPGLQRMLADQAFVNSAGQPASSGAITELAIEPTKKSWVRIRQDDPASAPIFEDYLYPNAGTLKVRGHSFFVEVVGDGDVNISKNGQPIAYQAPGITIP